MRVEEEKDGFDLYFFRNDRGKRAYHSVGRAGIRLHRQRCNGIWMRSDGDAGRRFRTDRSTESGTDVRVFSAKKLSLCD